MMDAVAMPAGRAEGLTPLVWASAFETGDVKVDDAHRELLVDINNLTRLLAEGGEWAQIVVMSRRLCHKCFAHFRDEEAVLERSKYRKRVAHAGEHRYIEKQIVDVLAHISGIARPSRAEVEAVIYLRSMLIHHFFRYDIAYKSHLLQTRSTGSPSRQPKAGR
jgi:hemerythrin-like metal-binding protein